MGNRKTFPQLRSPARDLAFQRPRDPLALGTRSALIALTRVKKNIKDLETLSARPNISLIEHGYPRNCVSEGLQSAGGSVIFDLSGLKVMQSVYA